MNGQSSTPFPSSFTHTRTHTHTHTHTHPPHFTLTGAQFRTTTACLPTSLPPHPPSFPHLLLLPPTHLLQQTLPYSTTQTSETKISEYRIYNYTHSHIHFHTCTHTHTCPLTPLPPPPQHTHIQHPGKSLRTTSGSETIDLSQEILALKLI